LNVVATLIDVAGAEPLEISDGLSFAQQVLAGPDAEGAQKGKEVVFSEVASHTMVFDGRYKLVVEALSHKPVELYDCETDPDEVDNRADDPELESVRRGLIDTHLSQIRHRLDESKLKEYEETPGKTYPR
jgi:arylsulfatase A-like enzyme